LGIVAVQIAYESALRLLSPVPIAYGEAIAVASLGLCVNIVSAWLLRDSHDHHHHGHAHAHDEDDHRDHDHLDHDHHRARHHRDNNFRAAYLHVLADAATSLLAIAALVVAMYSGWVWTDPAVGIVGSIVIASWAYTLIRDAGGVLLDVSVDKRLERTIRARLEAGEDRITDLHLWQVGPGHCAAVISLVSDAPLSPASYKERLHDLKALSHVTVEVERCPHHQAQAC
jgi:cation diffusion facilitator family transporter